jgi:hypothetical protein
LRRSFTISFRIYDGQSQQKNRLILTQSYIYCSKLFSSWLQIPMLIMSPKRSLEDILCLLRFLLLLHHPDCCRVMYCYSTFLFHYYYITSTIAGWCIAILRFFFLLLFLLLFLFLFLFFQTFLSARFLGDALIKLYETL